MNSNKIALKDMTKEEILRIALYFTECCRNTNDLEYFDEIQTLFNKLISVLNLETHAQKVLDAFVRQHEKKGILTPCREGKKKKIEYDCFLPLKKIYREDSDIYAKCDQWNTETEEDVSLVRAVFSVKDCSETFYKILLLIFFGKEDKNRKTFSIPDDSVIKDNIEAKCQHDLSKILKSEVLRNALNLSNQECMIVDLIYFCHVSKEFYNLVNGFYYAEENRLAIYAKCLGISEGQVKKSLRSDSPLIFYGIVDDNYKMDNEVCTCISEGDIRLLFCDVIKKDTESKTFSLETFSVKKEFSELSVRLLSSKEPVNILLYGLPGTGKTEYARSISRKAGCDSYFFKNEIEIDKEGDANYAIRKLCRLLSIKKEDGIIIIDEAENLLTSRISFFDMMSGGSSACKKGTVNAMLENSPNKVIWIMNSIDSIDESTLRRFTYSISFREMQSGILRNIACSKLSDLNISETLLSDIVELCGKYHVTGASIDNIAKTISGIKEGSLSEKSILKDVKNVLESNSTLLFGKKRIRDTVGKQYDISVLNTSLPAETIVEMVQNACSYSERNDGEELGIRMLFYGISGTGKTELARYIAEKLGKKIIIKRTSDIFGKYVGENEKNISKAFEEAESNGDILLFDEADSFFSNRAMFSNSWERNTVNEFLTQMEEFTGILICTTNLRNIMDPALQRRFHIMTEFKPLKQEGIKLLLRKYFSNYKFTKAMRERLMEYNTVTPGDFGTLVGKIRFMNPSKVNSGYIINELCSIQQEKKNKNQPVGKAIGFKN